MIFKGLLACILARMTTYIPGAGIKRPLGILEAPVYPDIRRAPIEVRSAGKHWRVDSGRTLLSTESMPQFVESAILAVPKDYATRSTGISSHKDVVNKNFRPPIIEPYLIAESLTRQPRPATVPRINPDATRWAMRNERMDDPSRFLTDLIKSGQLDSGVNIPYTDGVPDMPLPDLEMILPKTNIGCNPRMLALPAFDPIKVDARATSAVIRNDYLPVSGTSVAHAPLSIDGKNAWEDMVLDDSRVNVSASAGYETFIRPAIETELDRLVLEQKGVSTSAFARATPMFKENGEHALEHLELELKTPQRSATAFPTPMFTTEIDTGLDRLELSSKIAGYQRSGMEAPTTIDKAENYMPSATLLEGALDDKLKVSASSGKTTKYADRTNYKVRQSFHTKLQPKGEAFVRGTIPQHGLISAQTSRSLRPTGQVRLQSSAGIMYPRFA